MYQNKRIAALITAAGSGLRMGGKVPKQFLDYRGQMILKKTLMAFEENQHIDEIFLISRKEDMEFCLEEFGRDRAFSKIRAIIAGGKERQDSVFNGLKVLKKQGNIDYVLIHDGVRPFVSQEEIDDLIKRVFLMKAATLGVVLKDSLAKIEGGLIVENLDRSNYYLIHTPQAFALDLIYEAHLQAAGRGFTGTDDTALAKREGHEVSIVLGKNSNIKITSEEDLQVCSGEEGQAGPEEKIEAELEEDSQAELEDKKIGIRVGHGFDVHSFEEGRSLVLGGKEIPWEKGLLGHSDADVLTHAVIDAILGAAGLGDIGSHFPDTEDQYKGISSISLLEKTKTIVEKQGYEILAIDSVIVTEEPKLSPHFRDMAGNLARTLDISPGQVNVKATTTEKLGFCGRGEGMGAMALATLNKKR